MVTLLLCLRPLCWVLRPYELNAQHGSNGLHFHCNAIRIFDWIAKNSFCFPEWKCENSSNLNCNNHGMYICLSFDLMHIFWFNIKYWGIWVNRHYQMALFLFDSLKNEDTKIRHTLRPKIKIQLFWINTVSYSISNYFEYSKHAHIHFYFVNF